MTDDFGATPRCGGIRNVVAAAGQGTVGIPFVPVTGRVAEWLLLPGRERLVDRLC